MNHIEELQTKQDISIPKVMEMFKLFNFQKDQQEKSRAQYDNKWVEEQAKSSVSDSAFIDYVFSLLGKNEITLD